MARSSASPPDGPHARPQRARPAEGRAEEVEARLEALSREVEDLRRRTAALEAHLVEKAAGESAADGAGPIASEVAPQAALPTDAVGTVSLVGRTLVALGGAYLLRALTDAAVIPKTGGVVAGLAYAAACMGLCDREAGRGRRPSAVFHGLAAAAIAFPLIGETTARLSLLAAPTGAAVLVAFFALGLAVALRRDLAPVAWITSLSALATALALLVATRDLLPFSLALLVVATMAEALGLGDRWLGLRWPAAFGLDVAALVLAEVAARPGGLPEGYAPLPMAPAVAIEVLLPVLYLVGIGARTLLREQAVRPFEVVQTAAALLLGLGGAQRVIASTGTASAAVGVLALLLGAACYAAGFAFVERRGHHESNFYFYTTLAGLLVLAGGCLLLAGAVLAAAAGALALAALALGGRFDRMTLRVHGAGYMAVAAGASGLLGAATDGLLAPAEGLWRDATPAALAVALAAALGYGILVATRATCAPGPALAAPRTALAVLAGWILAGLAARTLVGLLGAGPGPAADAAGIATIRTAVLSALALALAWAGRRWDLSGLAWLVYSLLAAGGAKLLLEDMRHGRPATLFLSLTLYGGALLAAPRLLRREESVRPGRAPG